MKRRVCIIVASEMTVRAFLRGHLRALQAEYDVTVVVNTQRSGLLKDLGIGASLVQVAIERSVAPWRDVAALWSLYWLLRRGQFDIVHSMTPKAGLLAMTAASFAGVPIRIHTFTGQVWATRSGPVRAMLRALDALIARMATFTLADSASQREFLIREGVASASALGVLGSGSVSGVDLTVFCADPASRRRVREGLKIPLTDVVILFIGRLTRDKGLLDLARAFHALAAEQRDLRLLIVGPDEGGLRTSIAASCADSADRLHFLDFTDRPEQLMAASDVLCLPSYREGFGSVILEAAACGVPAVASRIYGIIDAVADGRTGLLHGPGDVRGLETALRRITEDADLRQTLGSAARTRAEREFSAVRLTAALLNLYSLLLRNSSSDGDAVVRDAVHGLTRPVTTPDSGGTL